MAANRIARTLVLAGLAAACATLFVTRYWVNRACIAAAASSCRLEDGSNVTGGAMLWGGVAVVLAVLTLRSALGKRR
ncbi:hypothetical protein [Roseibium suaedae]|uniref:Uncharacterized protein n=1 Tax=Roseibium suaedae TaxID=735517 RepID=A0A1M7P8K3_9HYPH|nr:hypothetical protein [Roseibium suaedae]SHN12989.1 hypothetical protein SAMN05444272_4203 [Roseibium suaedae]